MEKKPLIKHHLPLLSVVMCCTNYWDKCTLNKGKNGMRMPWPTAEEAQSIYSPARLGLIIMRLSRVALVDPLPTAALGVLHHQHAVGRGLAQRCGLPAQTHKPLTYIHFIHTYTPYITYCCGSELAVATGKPQLTTELVQLFLHQNQYLVWALCQTPSHRVLVM